MKTILATKARRVSASQNATADASCYPSQSTCDLPDSVSIALDDVKAMIAVLTDNRRHLLAKVMKRPMTLSELTVSLQRDRTAVTKDVKLLERAGLVHTRREPNPGHGIKTIVQAAAKRIEITAILGH